MPLVYSRSLSNTPLQGIDLIMVFISPIMLLKHKTIFESNMNVLLATRGTNQNADECDEGNHVGGLSKLSWALIGLWDRLNSVNAWP